MAAPQGTVLASFLFTFYTSDFRYDSENCHIEKFSDDATVLRCIREGNEEEYRSLINSFVMWCQCNHLQLKNNKTKKISIRRSLLQLHSPLRVRTLRLYRAEWQAGVGHEREQLVQKRNKGKSSFYRVWGPLEGMISFYEHSMSLLCQVLPSMLLCAGAVASLDTNRLKKYIK